MSNPAETGAVDYYGDTQNEAEAYPEDEIGGFYFEDHVDDFIGEQEDSDLNPDPGSPDSGTNKASEDAALVSVPSDPEYGMWQFVKSHPRELVTGATAVFVVVVLVELVKPWLKSLALKRDWDDHDISRILKTLPYIFGLGVAYVFDFQSNWEGLSGSGLNETESVILGAIFTGAGAQLAYMAIKEFRVIEVIRLRWYRFMGVTNEELDEIAKTDPVAPGFLPQDALGEEE